MEDIFWVAKISNIYLGCLKFLIFFGVNGRCLARAYIRRKTESTPPPLGLSISSNLSLLNAYKWAFVLVGFLSQWTFVLVGFCPVGFCASGLLS